MIVADYSALEMRLLACAALEQDMINIFLRGEDIHMGNASMVFGMPYADIVAAKKIDKDVKGGKLPESAMTTYHRECLDARQKVKTIGFGLNYGMKENKLARDLKITKQEALNLMNKYMGTYPAVKHFYESSIDTVRQYGYAFTLLGRRRFLPEINAGQADIRWRAERQASNLPIQGTAADVVKMAMILCDEAGLHDKYGYKMLIQVHDELMFEGPEESTKDAMKEIQAIMEDALPTKLAVPLTVEIASGKSWSECH
jgi:DNA polymerase-1